MQKPRQLRRQRSSGLATVGFWVSLSGLVFGWVPILGLLLALSGVTLATVGLVDVSRSQKPPTRLAIAAVFTGPFAVIWWGHLLAGWVPVLGLLLTLVGVALVIIGLVNTSKSQRFGTHRAVAVIVGGVFAILYGASLLWSLVPTSPPGGYGVGAPVSTSPSPTASPDPPLVTPSPSPSPAPPMVTPSPFLSPDPTPAAPTPVPAPAPAWVVFNVVDGDTIDVRSSGGTTERVRVIGIDTPERGECGFWDATAAMTVLVLGKAVDLTPGARDDRDRYNRILRYVDVDGVDAGLELIKAGLAIARYDSRDGYGSHPRETTYIVADRATANLCVIN